MTRHWLLIVFWVLFQFLRLANQEEKTPEEYIITFPEEDDSLRLVFEKYDWQLTISTPRSHDVMVNLTIVSPGISFNVTTDGVDTYQGVITSSSEPLIVHLFEAERRLGTPVTVRLTSDDRINVYAFNFFYLYYVSLRSFNVDAILARPVGHASLNDSGIMSKGGLRHIVVTSPLLTTFFLVTAGDNETEVSIQSPVPITLLGSGGFQTVPLKDGNVSLKLQSMQTLYTSETVDLTGVVVESDRPVVVSSGSYGSAVEGGCCYDHMWAQLPPVEDWGREYVTFPTSSMAEASPRSVDFYHVVAAVENTTVYIDCNTTATTFFPSAFSWTRLKLDTLSFHHIYGDGPIMVVKIVVGNRNIPYGLDPCMLVLTDTSRWSTVLTFPMPTTSTWSISDVKFDLTIVTTASGVSDLIMNGKKLELDWKEVSVAGRTTELVGGEVTNVGPGLHVLSSVTGKTRMSGYITAGATYIGLCFALGGDLSQTDTLSPYVSCLATSPQSPDSTETPRSPITTTDVISSSRFEETTTATTTIAPGTTTDATISTKPTPTSKEPTTTITAIVETTNVASTTTTTDSVTATNVANSTTTTASVPTTNVANTTTTTAATKNPEPAVRIEKCNCVKIPPPSKETQAEHEAAVAAVASLTRQIQTSLSLASHDVGAAKRRKTSTPDQRQSSFAVGVIAVTFVSLVLAVPLSFDLIRLAKWLQEKIPAKPSTVHAPDDSPRDLSLEDGPGQPTDQPAEAEDEL